MSDIKFHCDTCGQPILVDAAAVGRTIRCPSCQSALVIRAPKVAAPKPERARVKPALAKPAGQRRKPGGPGGSSGGQAAEKHPSGAAASPPLQPDATPRIEAVKSTPRPASKPTPEPVRPPPAPPIRLAKSEPPVKTSGPDPGAGSSVLGEPVTVQVAALTSEAKQAIVQAARGQLADASRWMPGVTAQGKFAYAARRDGETMVPVEVGDASATHHSLMGAILLEFHRRNVTATASGRTEFLDREIPAMIREIAPEVGAEPPAGTDGPSSSAVGLMGIAHAQCLAVLDGLARRYQAEARGEGSETLRQVRGFTLEELVSRAAKDELVTNAEIVRAAHRELTELRDRIAALEKPRAT